MGCQAPPSKILQKQYMAKSYSRSGLRRDNNFSDLSNSVGGLNNLLNSLVDFQGSTFITQDLDAIRGLYASGVTSTTYRAFGGSRYQFTNSNGGLSEYLPRVTYQNRLDKLRIFSGEPILNGGNGLTAKYYNSDQVFENTSNVFSGSPFKIDNFWESGNFQYTGKITPEAVSVNGGVEWEGFFVPTSTGTYNFSVSSSACFTVDFETQGYVSGVGTYTERSRIGITTTFSASGNAGTNIITLTSVSNTQYIAIGQSVSNANITTGSKVKDFNRSTGVITLEPPTGISNAVSSLFTNQNVTFFKTIGQDTSITYSTYPLIEARKYRIKFRYFIPQNIDAVAVTRAITFGLSGPDISTGTLLRYTYLYSLDYDFSDASKGILSDFLTNSILTGGGTIGSGSLSSGYVRVNSSKKIDVTYQPKTSVPSITKSSVSSTITSGSDIISISDTSGIQIGNYVFGSGIPDNTVVKEIVINSFIIVSSNATSSATTVLTFIDHRGFVKRVVGSSSGTTFTLSSGDTSLLKSGMILIASGASAYTGIITTGSSSSLTISPSQTIGAGSTAYFYQSRGLINNGLAEYCLPSQTKCLFVSSNTNSGSTVIPVVDTSGITNGWTVLGFQFAANTTVSSFTANSITISIATIRNLVAGANFTVTSESGDRSLCCPPTDTSPPFNPTLEGLETVAAAPSLRVDSGDVKFDALTATVSAANIANISSTDSSTKRIPIQTPSGTFNILCS